MVKQVHSITLDNELIKKFKEKTDTPFSTYINELIKKDLFSVNNKNPEVLEAELMKQRLDSESSIVAETEKIRAINEQLKGLEEKKQEYAEEQKLKAIEIKKTRERKIQNEIDMFPIAIKNGMVSTAAKREAYYRQRAKAMGFSFDDYVLEVVPKLSAVVL